MHRIMHLRFAFRTNQIDSPVKFRVLYALTNWAVVEFCRSVLFLLVVSLWFEAQKFESPDFGIHSAVSKAFLSLQICF